jgi:hypothetical protein
MSLNGFLTSTRRIGLGMPWAWRQAPPVRAFRTVFPWIALAWFAKFLVDRGLPGDVQIYFEARGQHLYLGELGGWTYAYSPAFAQVISPLQQLPFEQFRVVFMGAELWGLAYLFGPWWALAILVFQIWPIWHTLLLGPNLQIFVTAMLVLALNHPTAWPVLFLTKITPGIGILWPAFRGDWRAVTIGLGLTLAISAVSFAVAPNAWLEWFAWLASQVDASVDSPALPLWLRQVVAIGLLAWAAKRHQVWWVPVAAALAAPEGGGHMLLLLGAISLFIRHNPLQTYGLDASASGERRGGPNARSPVVPLTHSSGRS